MRRNAEIDNTHQCFLLFRRETFLSGLAWLSDYISAMELEEEGGAPLPVVLVGNKSDVDSVRRGEYGEASRREYETWVEDNNVIGFWDVSARNDTNIDLAIHGLLQHILTNSDGP